MSHSLHRQGKKESLKKDFVLISLIPKAIKKFWPDASKRMKKLGAICVDHNPDNYEHHKHIFQGCYSDANEIKELLKDLKEADLGLPVVLTGPRDDIVNMGREIGLEFNSVHLSLGVFGNKQRLPDKRILEMTTMCGHHCISPFLIEKFATEIQSGRRTMDATVNQLSDLCLCRIFNPHRAKEIFEELIAK